MTTRATQPAGIYTFQASQIFEPELSAEEDLMEIEPTELSAEEYLMEVESTEAPIQHLPEELLVNIFSMIGAIDLSKAAVVCRQWYRISQDAWKSVFPRYCSAATLKAYALADNPEKARMRERAIIPLTKNIPQGLFRAEMVTLPHVSRENLPNALEPSFLVEKGLHAPHHTTHPANAYSLDAAVRCPYLKRFEVVENRLTILVDFSDATTPPPPLVGNVKTFHQQGRTVFTGQTDGSITQWQLKDERDFGMLNVGDQGEVTYIRTFSANGLKPHDGAITALITHAGYLISGSEDTVVKLWDLESGKFIRALVGHTSPIYTLEAADGKLFSLSLPAPRATKHPIILKMWNMNKGELIVSSPIYIDNPQNAARYLSEYDKLQLKVHEKILYLSVTPSHSFIYIFDTESYDALSPSEKTELKLLRTLKLNLVTERSTYFTLQNHAPSFILPHHPRRPDAAFSQLTIDFGRGASLKTTLSSLADQSTSLDVSGLFDELPLPVRKSIFQCFEAIINRNNSGYSADVHHDYTFRNFKRYHQRDLNLGFSIPIADRILNTAIPDAIRVYIAEQSAPESKAEEMIL